MIGVRKRRIGARATARRLPCRFIVTETVEEPLPRIVVAVLVCS
jgi:hypothetical protein